MEEVKVNLPAGGYTIHIGPKALEQAGLFLSRLGLSDRALIVTDANVGPLYGKRVAASLSHAGITAEIITVAPGEASKSLATAGELYSAAIAARVDRRSPIIALGGGVVGDLAGFVAATYQRGVPFIQLPTTLLAQVDSSVGGKVAVNHPQGKNLIGAFYQPSLVVADTETLATLPVRELTAGLAEVVKYGVIADAEFFTFLSSRRGDALAGDNLVLSEIVRRSCIIKAQVVEQDERDTGLRMILNFGHTVGHAIEAAGGFARYNHGEAVAIGMHAAAILSRRLGLCDGATVDSIARLLRELKLPVTAAGYRPDELLTYLSRDKKSLGGKLNWVLVNKLGQVVIKSDVPESEVRSVLADITAGEG